MAENYLIISDLQAPFQAEKALNFCSYLKKHFKVLDENCYNVGDEVDHYFGGLYKRNPNMKHSPTSEIQATIDELKRWYAAFPKMKLAISNHMLRWINKAVDAEIPTTLLRKYEEVIQAPDSWIWKDEWVIQGSKHTFRMIHGMGYSGQLGHVNAALDAGVSTVIGHLASFGGVNFLHNISGKKLWAANAGCLIDIESLAFHYGKYMRRQPTLGCVVVLDGGRTPVFVPYD